MSRFKWISVAAVAATVVFSTVEAQASRLFLSTSGISPLIEVTGSTNPTLNVTVGQIASLFLWWKPTNDPTLNNSPEKVDGLSHDIVSTNPILSRTSYTIANPNVLGTDRWDSVSSGGGVPTFMVDDANAVTASGSNLGQVPLPNFDNTYDAATGTWRVATLTFQATATGTTSIFLGVGSLGIAFKRGGNNDPPNLPINFGWNDAAIDSGAFNTQSTLADATVVVSQVPEPATMVLMGMGAAGLAFIARRRRAAPIS